MRTGVDLRRRAPAVGGVVLALGAMHLALDGLTGVLVPLQPVLQARTGARPVELGALVALALASATLLQPLTAAAAMRWGDGRAAIFGALLAAVGYGTLPAAASTWHAAAAVVVGGTGSALFHPGAGALVARAAPPGGEALPLAAFSAVGTGGAALVPLVVLSGIGSLATAAALPVAAALAAPALGLLLSGTARRRPRAAPHGAGADQPDPPAAIRRRPLPVVPVAVAALLSLVGVSASATAPLILAETVDRTSTLLGYTVASYSAAGAVGGIALALTLRRARLTVVLRAAVAAGTIATLTLPHVPAHAAPAVMLAVGAGLSGALPLLVTLAKRPGETSAAGAVGRILGLATGLGALGYAGTAVLHAAIGYGPALSLIAGTAGGLALLLIGQLSTDTADPQAALEHALTACGCGSCACGAPSTAPRPLASGV